MQDALAVGTEVEAEAEPTERLATPILQKHAVGVFG
jgi:hypothetical protein